MIIRLFGPGNRVLLATLVLGWFALQPLSAADTPAANATPGMVSMDPDQLHTVRPSLSELQRKGTLGSSDIFIRPRAAPMLSLPQANRAPRSLLDDESAWPFITPDDVIHDYLMREVLKMPVYGPDGRDISKYSPVERFFMRTSPHGMTNNAMGASPFDVLGRQSLFDSRSANNDSKKDGEKDSLFSFNRPDPLQVKFPGNSNDDPERRNPLTTMPDFRSDSKDLISQSPEALKAQKEADEKQMDAFREALGFAPPTAAGKGFDPFGITASPNASPRSQWETAAPPGLGGPADLNAAAKNAGLVPGMPAPPVVPTVPSALSQASSIIPGFPTPPAATPPPAAMAPSRVDFAIPQRRF